MNSRETIIPTQPVKRITLADVAREAGVSVQAASHVMSGNMTVRLPEATRARVRAAAARIGYQPNRIAQAMKTGRTKVLGVWMPIDRAIPNYLRMLHLLGVHAKLSGYEVMITGLTALDALTSGGQAPRLWPVDAIIAIDAEKAVESLRLSGESASIPIVVMGYQQFVNSDSVTWDLQGAARGATDRMIEQGARRIAFVTLDWVFEKFPREKRRQGYVEAMESAGLEPEFITVATESSWAAEEAVSAYLDKSTCPDAFFGFTDPLAIGAARAAMAKGIEVPKDCMIWGSGDFPEGEEARVPISTIRAPLKDAIALTWQRAMERIEGASIDSRLTVLPMELVERQSTKR